jgi:DNA-directed RNA polymerase subunit F
MYKVVIGYRNTESLFDHKEDAISYIHEMQRIWSANRTSYRVEIFDSLNTLLYNKLVGEINDILPECVLDLSSLEN